MTPDQIALVERTLTAVDVDALAAAMYERAFVADPTLSEMFTTDPATQRARFALELTAIVRSMRVVDDLTAETGALGARHHAYGVRPAHYRLMGDALLGALAGALGDAWTAETEQAWALAYHLTAEAMQQGALEERPRR